MKKRTMAILMTVVLMVGALVSAASVFAETNDAAKEYYAESLKEFLALGKQNIAVILRDIDCDGFDELVTIWEIYEYVNNFHASAYTFELNIYDYDEGEKIHIKDEGVCYFDFGITKNGYLASCQHGTQLGWGWVYADSEIHKFNQQLDRPDPFTNPVFTFDGRALTADEYRDICSQYGLDGLEKYAGYTISFDVGESIYPYANTQADIDTILGWTTTPISITLNGAPIATDVAPYVDSNNRTMVPARFVSEALGADVSWDEATETVTIKKTGTTITLKIGSDTLYKNGAATKMDTAAVLTEERTFVPVRFIAEALGLKVEWDEENMTVKLSTP